MKKTGKRFVCFLLIFTAFISSTSTLVSCAKLREIGASIKDGANDVVDTTLSKSKQIIEKIKESAVDVYDVVRDEAIYVYDKAANFVSDGYETVSDKVNEIIGDVDEFITDLNGNYEPQPVEFFEADTNRLVKDKFADVFIDNFDSIQIGQEYLTEKFVPYYISSVLSKRGFDVYSGCVYYKGKIFGRPNFYQWRLFY